MSKYQILYIDEQKEARDEVKEKLADDVFDVNILHPYATEEEMMNYIANEKSDAIIVDYGLKRDDPTITYNGSDIINKIGDIKEDFPVFILTRDIEQDGGIDDQVDSTIILLKDDLYNTDKLNLLKRKVEKLIKRYYEKNEKLSEEYYALVKKKSDRKVKLNNKELERLDELDEKIERRMLGKRKFPKLLKDSSSIKQLNKILKEAEEFIEKNNKKKK